MTGTINHINIVKSKESLIKQARFDTGKDDLRHNSRVYLYGVMTKKNNY
ncbi:MULTISPECIES: hypothetical protein [Brasilonema]|nr:hypothetical protein [Brasilonema octagenarum]